MEKFETVEDYLAAVPDEQRAGLERLRAHIKAAAPDATEKMAYGVPNFTLDGPLVAYGAAKKHSALYVMSTSVLAELGDAVAGYDHEGGTLRFPIDRPPPAALVKRIVKARMRENAALIAERAARKAAKKPARK
jgi:uncharacterized protein YdhG (YjbR/CyaY superfamily)